MTTKDADQDEEAKRRRNWFPCLRLRSLVEINSTLSLGGKPAALEKVASLIPDVLCAGGNDSIMPRGRGGRGRWAKTPGEFWFSTSRSEEFQVHYNMGTRLTKSAQPEEWSFTLACGDRGTATAAAAGGLPSSAYDNLNAQYERMSFVFVRTKPRDDEEVENVAFHLPISLSPQKSLPPPPAIDNKESGVIDRCRGSVAQTDWLMEMKRFRGLVLHSEPPRQPSPITQMDCELKSVSNRGSLWKRRRSARSVRGGGSLARPEQESVRVSDSKSWLEMVHPGFASCSYRTNPFNLN